MCALTNTSTTTEHTKPPPPFPLNASGEQKRNCNFHDLPRDILQDIIAILINSLPKNLDNSENFKTVLRVRGVCKALRTKTRFPKEAILTLTQDSCARLLPCVEALKLYVTNLRVMCTKDKKKEDFLRHIGGMGNLTHFNVRCDDLNDDDIAEWWNGMRKLKNLSLASCKGICGSGLAGLCKLNDLEEVDIGYSNALCTTGLKNIAAIPKLHTLSLPRCKNLKADDWTLLRDCKTLRNLVIENTDLKEVKITSAITTLTHLECLTVIGADRLMLRKLSNAMPGVKVVHRKRC